MCGPNLAMVLEGDKQYYLAVGLCIASKKQILQ
jgi:hypothetical protein